jgi:hypothetical protein
VAILDAHPWGVAISSDGTIYFTELETNRVRMVRDGQVTTVAESGVPGYADGAALQAQFNNPAGLTMSPNGGAIYVTDQNNNRVRMIRDGQVTGGRKWRARMCRWCCSPGTIQQSKRIGNITQRRCYLRSRRIQQTHTNDLRPECFSCRFTPRDRRPTQPLHQNRGRIARLP